MSVVDEHRRTAAHRADATTDISQAATVARPLLPQCLIVEAIKPLSNVGEVGAAPLFAITDDVDAGKLLVMDGQANGVVLRLPQQLAFKMP